MIGVPEPAVMPAGEGRAGATVRVHPLLTGEILAPPVFFKRPDGPLGLLEGLGLHVPPRRWQWCPIPAFLVEHPTAGGLLIDTGLDASVLRDPAEQFGWLLKHLFRLRVVAGQDAVSQARERGVEPGAIRTVILTHLHYDHAGGAGQLPHAAFLFDGREWVPARRGRLLEGYRRETVDRPLDWRALEFAGAPAGGGFSHTLDLLGDGSIRLLSTPGHSNGHISVSLRTAAGPVLVVGDAAYTRRAIAEDHDQIARADAAAYRTSLQCLRRWADEHPTAPVICSHDYEFWANAPPLYA
jgi:N-acyl homoserine lactone hydrolase